MRNLVQDKLLQEAEAVAHVIGIEGISEISLGIGGVGENEEYRDNEEEDGNG